MRAVLFVCFTLSLIVSVHVLTCIPGYCETHPCTSPESCPEGEGLHSNPCSCCKYCVPLIPEGGRCVNLYGVPQNTRCKDGTQCIQNVCKKVDD
ncbi:hypothetical protein FQR65_LT01334 [Abscondita terminalis]|nr:hypothetical protein FQR65_LT01334 [Abscondita terminalis]